jgi:hypothetical protein
LGLVRGKLGDHPAVLQKVIPSHQSAIRDERLVAATQMKLPARWQKFEIQFSFTHWVNQFFVGFRLQTPLPVALALRILNLNCGLDDQRIYWQR